MNELVKNKARGDEFDVYIGRPSRWGNPFSHKDGTLAEFKVSSRDEAVDAYKDWLWTQIKSGEVTRDDLRALHGKRLGCWCAPARCHGEVLVEAAEWAMQDEESEPSSDGFDHLFIALAMQADADDQRAAANAAFAFDPHVFRVELEAALVKALGEFQTKCARTAVAADRRARREALQARAAAVVDEPRLPASVSILTEDWFAEAPKATGEDVDLFADEDDPDLRQAAMLLARGHDERTIERLTGFTVYEAECVPLRTADAIGRDEDDLLWLRRDSIRAPKGYGMTNAENRRKWLMDARLRYAAMLREAVEKHRGRIGRSQAIQFPALRSEAQYARSVMAKWAFVDELARHGVWNPDTVEVRKLKAALGRTYDDAVEVLVRRRDAAERGLLDRYRHELV